jgi:hypothetical protein
LKRVGRLQGLLTVAALGCLGTSFRLWTPQQSFPQIPLLPDFAMPDLLAWGVFGFLIVSLLWQLFSALSSRPGRLPAAMFIVCAMGLFLEDQHRMQPWMLHFLWLSLILLIGSSRRTMSLVVMLTSSLYFYSALSKCNLMFLEQHGQVILAGLFKSLGLDLGRIPENLRRLLIAGFPLGEFAIATGLLFNRWRRLAAIAALAMHGLLIVTFSPLGLNHEWGVLIWNAFFLLQALCLWTFTARVAPEETGNRSRDGIALASGLCFWLFPLLRFSGHLDQWVCWSLYSPRSEVVRISLAVAPGQIDENFPDYTSARYRLIQGDTGPFEFVPDRWSIASMRVPLNPETRLELAVARSLCEKYDAWDRVVVIHETRDLWNPKQRKSQQYQGRDEIASFAAEFRLPTRSNRRFRQSN